LGQTRTLNIAIGVSALVAVVAATFAVVELRRISIPSTVDIPVPTDTVRLTDGVAGGSIRDGLPRYERHWDGQPPGAVLVAAPSGAVLAAAAFSDPTFDENSSAVRFADGEVRFKLPARQWTSSAPLLIRCEAVQPRRSFIVWSSVAALASIAFMVLLAMKQRGIERLGSLLFIAIACGTFASVYPGAPVRVDEVGDEAALNSFAAASDHPERFALDRLLSDPSVYQWYTPAYVRTIRVFKSLGFHYQTANAFLGGGAALLFLFGLRRLFTTVSGRADVALAATLALGLAFDETMPPGGEYWSILQVLPRTIFAAFMPWVLVLAMATAGKPRRWWIPCVAASLLLHIHPLSAPALAAAILLALVVASDEPIRARVVGAALAVAAVVVTMLPYALVYISHYTPAATVDAAMNARALELVQGSFAHTRLGLVLRQLAIHRLTTLRILVDVFAVVLLVRGSMNRTTKFFLGLVAGYAIVSFALPAIDSAVAGYFGRRQLEYEFVRNIRYLDLLAVLGVAIGVSVWKGSRTQARVAVWAGALCAVLAFGPGWFHTARMAAGRSRLSWRILNGHPDVESASAQEAIRALVALRAPTERVAGPMGLRQFDVPLAWTSRDVAAQSYAVTPGLIESAAVMPQVEAIVARPLTAHAVGEVSSTLQAPLLLVRRSQMDSTIESASFVLFRNRVYAVLRAAPTAAHN